MEVFNTFLDAIGFSPAFDTLAILFLAITSFFYGVTIGRKRLITILTGTYLAFSVYTVFPFKYLFLSKDNSPSSQFFISVALFFGLLAVICAGLGSSRGQSFLSFRRNGLGSWWYIFVSSLLQVGIIVTIILALFLEKLNIELTPFTTRIFGDGIPRFLWFLAPVIWLSFLKRSGKE